MTQGYPQGGWAPPPGPPPGMPAPAGASQAPAMVVGIAAAVMGFLHLLIAVGWYFGFYLLAEYFPLYSVHYVNVPFLPMLAGLAGIAGGVLLVVRFGWARFVVMGAGVVAVLDVLAMLPMGVGELVITLLFYALLWLALGVTMFMPPVGRALNPGGPAQPLPQQFQLQQFQQPGPQQFQQPGPPQGYPPQQFPPPGYPPQGPPR